MIDELLSIKDAAKAIGVSEKTVRRRIQKGELKAELRDCLYGKQYFLPRSQINTAQEIIDVIQVKKEHDIQSIATIFSAYINKRESSLVETIQQLQNTVESLKKDNENLKEQIKQENITLQGKLQEQQEIHLKAINEQLEQFKDELKNEKNKSWFKRILKK